LRATHQQAQDFYGVPSGVEGRIENLAFYEHFGGLYAALYEAKRLEIVRAPPKYDIKGGPELQLFILRV